MHRIRLGALALVLVMAGGATIALAGTGGGDRGGDRDGKRGWGWGHKWSKTAKAVLRNAEGEEIGRVWLRQDRRDDKVTLFAHVRDVPPGFHGFHIHTIGNCTPPTFTSAGGHFNPTGAHHPDHAGDLPSLLVQGDGTALLATQTDRFSLSDLRDADGSAVMIHAGRDNFANIPERYLPPPIDQMTLDTGDAGARFACGEVR